MSDDQITKAAGSNAGSGSGQSLLTEVGRGGLRQWGGYIYDDEDPQLRGLQAIRKYREMTKDPTIAAMLFALTALFRSVSWRIEASGDTPAHREARDFVDGVLFEDMEHTWEDFVADAVTMFPYGFAPFEMVYRKRTGTPKGADPLAGSQYKDGKIGLRKIALRSQDTVQRWWFDPESDGLLGLYQLDPVRGREVQIPMERLVLIRTTANRGNPEGKSILEPAVRPYTALRMFENAEASVAVRAGGIVTLEIPVGDYNDPTKRASWEQLAKEMADDRAGFILLPTIVDKEGKKVDAYKVDYTVADGRRSGDFSIIIGRKKQEMASVALADFILLGHNNKGALNLSTDKTNLLREAVMSYLRGIAAQVNRVVIPRLWAVNGLPRDTMPKAVPGDLDKANLQVLGTFLTAMTGAGMVMDDALEDALRAAANLPLKPKELEGQGDEGGSAVSRPGKRSVPTQRPKKPAEAPADDDGLVDAAPDAPTGGRPSRSASTRAAVSKAAPEDIVALAALGADDPVYREALAVLAGGEIPEGVEKAEGGLPGGGLSPFVLDVLKAWNPAQPRDHLGRFARMADRGSGAGGGHAGKAKPLFFGALPADLLTAHFHGKRRFSPGGVQMNPAAVQHHLEKHPEDSKKMIAALRGGLAKPALVSDPESGENGLNVALYYPVPNTDGEMFVLPVSVDRDGAGFYWARSGFVTRKHQVEQRVKKGRIHYIGKRPKDKPLK
ncbi:phage portal protein family protein [Azospirillum himalayense]|uniref:Phage portal protein n=1 Tax=Azospirillum himalayense TaxID=654847 RepID=A0ABW0GAH6_9PROT